jgi:hypothetical protein
MQHLITCHLVLRLRGGFKCEFSFNSLTHKKKIQFSNDPNAPNYRRICPGLNLEAICSNKSCLAYDKKVWIQKGFGMFNMGKEINICICPLCKFKTLPATNIGYYLTYIKIDGKQK